MGRARDPNRDKAFEIFKKAGGNIDLVEIASQLNLPEGTIRSWKNRYQWDCNVANKKRNVANKKRNVANRKRGGQPGNKNALNNDGGAPLKNKNAEKYGFFSKYLPDETREIFSAISDADPLELLWHQIQIAYAAIIRAQKIAYVRDQEDKTIEKVEEKVGNVIGERWEVQQAWDKQNNFLKAQARAQGELRSLIKQYDEMLHKNWELASEEQKMRVERIKVDTDRLKRNICPEEEEGVEIINDLNEKAGTSV